MRPVTTALANRAAAVRARPVELGVYAGLAVVLAVVLVANAAGHFAPDTKPELYLHPWRTLYDSLSVWTRDPYLGGPGFNGGIAPVAFVIGVIRTLGVPAWLAVQVWRLALLLVAALGAVRLLRDLTGSANSAGRSAAVARVAVAVGYVANPYVISGGGTTPTLLPYALLPWLLLVLRRGLAQPRSWRWPAAFALVFAAMSGINAGVVPLLQLIAVPCVLLDARLRGGRPVRALLSVTIRCALLSVGLSLYWLIPAVAAAGAGQAIATGTESLESIHAVSSFGEVLRGLGFWPLYGADGRGPFVPGHVSYVLAPAVVVASFGLPLLAALGALWSSTRARLLPVLLVLVGAVVMAGLFPVGDSSPFGQVLEWAFAHVRGAVAFRTTNKAGAVLILGLALLAAMGAQAVAERIRGRGTAIAALVGVGGIALGSVAPVLSGDLYPTRVDLPRHWRDVAAYLRDASPEHRVLFVPGFVLARFRWGYEGPDDLNRSVLRTPSAVRAAVPNGTPAGANLMAALDGSLNENALGPGGLSALARYLGADRLLVRHDTEWEVSHGARPAEIAATIAADPGLTRERTFGPAGRFTATADPAYRDPAAEQTERSLHPVELYRVSDPLPVTRSVAAAGTVVIDGDASAIPELIAAGLIDGTGGAALRFAGEMSGEQLADALRDGARLVLTDTNRRREANPRRLAVAAGPTLDAPAPTTVSHTLFSPDDQTVTRWHGVRSVEEWGPHAFAFGPVPYGHPAFAFDGDPATAWQFGDFGNLLGHGLTVAFDAERPVDRVVLHPVPTGPSRIVMVRVRAGSAVRDVELPDGAEAVPVDLGGARASSVSIEVIGGIPLGLNPVGFAEIEIPGVTAARSVRLPARLAGLTRELAGVMADEVSAAPVDVVITRSQADRRTPDDDEETALFRSFDLPVDRSFTLSGRLRVAPATSLTELAALFPGRVPARASASSGKSSAAAAFDGRWGSAWSPAGPAGGQWIRLDFPRRVVDRLRIGQGSGAALVRRVAIETETGTAVVADLRPGVTEVVLPRRATSWVRLTVLQASGPGAPAFPEISLPGVTAGSPGQPSAPACVPVGSVDGLAVSVQVAAADIGRAVNGEVVPFTGCGAPWRLAGGPHKLQTSGPLLVDQLVLADTVRAPRVGPGPESGPEVTVLERVPAHVSVRVAAADAPSYLVLGEGFDQGWRARADGVDLGPPMLLNGYSAGWLLPPGPARTVEMGYGPQYPADVARAASVLVLGLCLWLVVRRRSRASGAAPWSPGLNGPAQPPRIATREAISAPQELTGVAIGGSGDGDRKITGPGSTCTSAVRDRSRTWLATRAWALLPVVVWLLAGTVPGIAAALLAGWQLVRAPAPKTLLRAAAALLAAVPLSYLLTNIDRLDRVGFDLVSGHLWPHHTAAVALTLLAVGVLREVLAHDPCRTDTPSVAPRDVRQTARRYDTIGTGEGRG